MTLATFLAIGLLCALALLVSAVILAGLVVTVSVIVRVVGVMAAIVREGRDGQFNKPVARAQARNRWVGAWREHW